ncbi:hypothetical protein [Kitasatospora sp. McL0602]|uniref:hypothetical protein n=1 Tax=Kitasatospora sp. McL0602 TaxID=3439530 RepID=UPI003F8C255F
MSRPLLFLDVDGPLNPYAAEPAKQPEGYTTLCIPQEPGIADEFGSYRSHRRPPRVWLNPDHGRALMALDYELCWATTWMSDANRWIGPAIGLPELPYVDFGDSLLNERPDGVHWKSAALLTYANGRPFAWVDDEQGDADHAYMAASYKIPALLHHVNPRIGLQDDDFAALAAFAGSLAQFSTLGGPGGA